MATKTKESMHALRARIYECCYSNKLTEEEKDQLYDEICTRLQSIEEYITTKPQQQAKKRVRVKGFAQN